MNGASLILPLSALILAPLLLGIVNRTKAIFAGRKGRPLLQLYHDLCKLSRKGAVYSRTTSWVFRAGPVVGLASALTGLLVLPLGGAPAPVSFPCDLVFLAYLLGLMRFFTVIAALDTGSAFEGMGASREVQFSALAEPALLLGLAAVGQAAQGAGSSGLNGGGSFLSLSGMYAGLSMERWMNMGPALLLVAGALLVVFLAESSRIPVDDPDTHLELTMIHEVMVLDHSGPDLAMILYAASLKMWILGALLMGILVPVRTGSLWLDGAAAVGGLFLLAVITGVVESTMARLRLIHVPQLLVGAGFLSALALVLVLWS
jgi:formate hydrogenlyase subunit 4